MNRDLYHGILNAYKVRFILTHKMLNKEVLRVKQNFKILKLIEVYIITFK